MKNLFLILVSFLLIKTNSHADGLSSKIYLEEFGACKSKK